MFVRKKQSNHYFNIRFPIERDQQTTRGSLPEEVNRGYNTGFCIAKRSRHREVPLRRIEYSVGIRIKGHKYGRAFRAVILWGLTSAVWASGQPLYCPTHASELGRFRDSAARLLNDVEGGTQEAVSLSREVLSCLAVHRATIGQQPYLQKCFREVNEFSQSLLEFREEPKKQDFSRDEALQQTQIPGELIEPAFLAAIDDPSRLNEAREYIQKLNQKRGKDPILFLNYTSILHTSDEARSLGRYLIYYPDAATGRALWIQFGAPNAISHRASPHLFVMAMVAAKDQGTIKGHFASYPRYWDGSRSRLSIPSRGTPKTCTECHRSGSPVSIPWSRVPEKEREVAKQMNEIIRNYQPVIPSHTSPLRLGPGLGPLEQKRSDAFLNDCGSKKLAAILSASAPDNREAYRQEIFKRIRSGMSCAQCHDGEVRTLLNPPLRDVYTDHILTGTMPPGLGQTMSASEREMLLQCLNWEYFGHKPGNQIFVPGLLYKHLTQGSCEPIVPQLEAQPSPSRPSHEIATP